jgi:sialic acid synthase SpsE
MSKNEKNALNIDGICYSPEKPLIIAELGTSHNGDIEKAKEMINAAVDCGADCVKVQMVIAQEILHPNTGEVPLPGGRIRLFDQFKTLEKPPQFYADIMEYAESKGVLFLCTPFGLESARILKELNPKFVKIASPELNYTSLLEEIALWNLPVLLSSGVSTLADIENAVNVFKLTNTDICLLHCVTSYPAAETEYNLKVLPNLSAVFGIPVGVSDHSIDEQLVPALCVSMGACVIEKHFCLSKTDSGLDDPIALEPKAFLKMVNAVNQAANAGANETIAAYSRERGADLIQSILGDGIKKLAPCEKANYKLTNRSIHALRDIQKGEILKKNDYAVLRSEKILRPGLEPCWENLIEGRTARNFIPSGEGIRFEDI